MTQAGLLDSRGYDPNDQLERFLIYYASAIEDAAFTALTESSTDVAISAQGTGTYEDVTGATRVSTVAYVTDENGPNEIPFVAIEDANDLNPGHADEQSMPPYDDLTTGQIALYSMSATDYSYFLNIRKGGESMYLEASIMDNMTLIMNMLQSEIDKRIAELASDISMGRL